MAKDVIVLNGDFTIINTVSVKKAKHMINSGKAVVVKAVGDIKDLVTNKFIPEIIKLVKLVREIYGRRIPWSKGNLVARDNHRCQYCGCERASRNLEIEHVIPRAQGGKTTWENTVAACRECNQKKADKTPSQAGMSFYKRGFKPYQPTIMEFINQKIELYGLNKVYDDLISGKL